MKKRGISTSLAARLSMYFLSVITVHITLVIRYSQQLKLVIFEASTSTPGGDRHMRLVTYLYQIESLTTFI